MEPSEHKELLRQKFANQARLYPDTIKLRHAENIVPMIELARPKKTDQVLDVATGWGFAALGFAPRVAKVTGVDLTPEMVDLARKVAEETGAANVEYMLGDAEDLKLEPGSFDVVLCRLTFHHFTAPEKALSEMKRVLAPGGRLILYDFLADADKEKAKRQNDAELARDPSHVRIYRESEFESLFRKCRLEYEERVVTLMKRDFDAWMAFVGADKALKDKVRAILMDPLRGRKAGFYVRERKGKITFSHTCICWRLTALA